MRLLVVEDEQQIVDVLKSGLQGADFTVDAVGTAEEAEYALTNISYDAAVLDLGLPDSVTALATEVNEQSAPNASAITYEFPKKGRRGPVTYHWLDGGLLPPALEGIDHRLILGPDKSGTVFVGTDGLMVTDTYTRNVRILPEAREAEVKADPPAQSIERISGTHHDDWVRAIKEGGEACSNFDYAAPLTEVGLLGNVAIRARTKIEYDAARMQVTNLADANRLLSKPYPDGWILG